MRSSFNEGSFITVNVDNLYITRDKVYIFDKEFPKGSFYIENKAKHN